MTDLIEIGNNIVLLRKEQGLTQEETAFRSNLSVSRLQYIEYGCQNTTTDTLIRLAETLGVDPRVFAIFSRPENVILSEVRRSVRLPERKGDRPQICDNIVRLRKKRRLSQEQLARLSHISPVCLRDIEHGCGNTTTKKLVSIAKAFGLSPTELNLCSIPEEELLELVRQAKRMAGLKV